MSPKLRITAPVLRSIYRSLLVRRAASRCPVQRAILSARIMLAVSAMGSLLTLAVAPTEPVKPRCSFVYINGDLVITCPKAGR